MGYLLELLVYPVSYIIGWFLGRSWHEAGSPEMVKLDFAVRSLPKGLEDLTILHLSDLHGPQRASLIPLIAEAVRSLAPDCIAVTGDLARNDHELLLAETLLRGLEAPLGIFCVYGNNDLRFNPDLVRRAVEDSGAVLLDNTSITVTKNGTPVRLVGINHRTACSPRWRLHHQEDTPPFTLILMHGPAAAAKLEIGDLVLAGHTHGGQLCLEPLTWLSRRVFSIESLAGKTLIGSRPVYISRGIGTKMLPLRFRCPPEITLITIKKKTS
ncbi:MAG: metallophosphoesterase family protein [bacterium]|jgi:hypothetical protein|nr:metallophosphoesterase family protein [bacterium]